MLAALTIDLEDWHGTELLRGRVAASDRTDRILQTTRPILERLRAHGRSATFFVVGEVMARHPELVREIAALGHEIGCHGMTHTPLWSLGPEGLARELDAFAGLARDVLGAERIAGFRAPTFSLDRTTAWAIPILASRGYRYDASVFPVRTPLYGVAGAPLGPHRVGPLVEVPATVAVVLGQRVPIGGGLYLRALPGWLHRRLLARAAAERPIVLYVHPWETDRDLCVRRVGPLARLATCAGTGGALHKLDRLLAAFPWTTLAELVRAIERSAREAS